MNLVATAMRERRERQAALLADPRTPQEVRDAVEGYANGTIDRAELVTALELAGEGDAGLSTTIKLNLGWAWCDDEVDWITSG